MELHGSDQHLLRKENLYSSVPIDLLIEIETRTLQDSINRTLTGKDLELIPDALKSHQEQYNKGSSWGSNNNQGGKAMGGTFPSWAVTVLRGGSVEALRRAFQESKGLGAELFSIKFDQFFPSRSPESRARMGVVVVQTASFMKGQTIASLPPERYGGMVKEKDLPEAQRLDLLKMIAAQGFLWVEVEDDIDPLALSDIVNTARKANSKVLLATRIGPDGDWSSKNRVGTDKWDGLKVVLNTDDPSSMRKGLAMLYSPSRDYQGKPRMVCPVGRHSQLVDLIAPFGLSDLVVVERKVAQNGSVAVPVQQDPIRSWGLLDDLWRKDVKGNSIQRWTLSGSTDVLVQLGGPGTANYKIGMHNAAFHSLGQDRIMVPWETNPDSLDQALTMMREADIKGAIVEMPLRTSSVPKLDWVDPRSKQVGSIDVIVCKGSELYGYNSELYAVSDLLQKAGAKKGMRCLVLGTGSTGRSTALAASVLGMETFLLGSNLKRTKELAGTLSKDIIGVTLKAVKRPGMKFEVIVSTTRMEGQGEGSNLLEGSDIVDTVKAFSPSIGMDTTVLRGWSSFLAAIETCGGHHLKGSDLFVRTAYRTQSIWSRKPLNEDHLIKVLEDGLTGPMT